MDAPVFPPATAFVQPARQLHFMSASASPITELRDNPAAWAIVQKEIPEVTMITKIPAMAVHLGNMSLASLSQYMPGMTPDYTALDAKLRALGQVK